MLNEDFGITVVFITHYMDEAAKAKRVIVMDEGKITGVGTHKQLLENCTEYGEIYSSQMDKKEE